MSLRRLKLATPLGAALVALALSSTAGAGHGFENGFTALHLNANNGWPELASTTVTSAGSVGLRVTTTAAGGRGLEGLATAQTGAGVGVYGSTTSGEASARGVVGVLGSQNPASDAAGVLGHSFSGTSNGAGVWGLHSGSIGTAPGVYGRTNSSAALAAGVFGEAPNGSQTAGVYGSSAAFGVLGIGSAAGVVGYNPPGLAGYFVGNAHVTGTLTKGAGAFRIDHPLEPGTKYLQHSFVESPDMKNVYDGVVTTNRRGYATVRLPRYFQALNRSFRYQLTVVGRSFAQAIVWKEIAGNRFTIKTDEPRVKVSWQITGIRQDAYANANRIETEVAKSSVDRASLRPSRLAARLR